MIVCTIKVLIIRELQCIFNILHLDLEVQDWISVTQTIFLYLYKNFSESVTSKCESEIFKSVDYFYSKEKISEATKNGVSCIVCSQMNTTISPWIPPRNYV